MISTHIAARRCTTAMKSLPSVMLIRVMKAKLSTGWADCVFNDGTEALLRYLAIIITGAVVIQVLRGFG